MKITADTNVLVRAMTGDDKRQSNVAQAALARADVVALALLDAGGDFADGVIAYEGSWLGAETLVSFDKKAVKLMKARGESARLLS